jgi:sensor histidine kinase YesM
MRSTSLFLRHKWLKKILLHVLFWVLIVVYFAWGFGFDTNFKRSFLNAAFYLPGHMIMVYSLVYFLIPRYLITKRYWLFFGGFFIVLCLCACYALLAQLTFTASSTFAGMTMGTGRNILPFIHVGGIAVSINLLKYWYLQQQKTMEAQQQRTAAELQLLKSQVHPHFLFNTLNNLYAYVLEQSPYAPEIVLKLSSLLRFMIYESSVPLILLTKEIALLKEYISLEQLRYGSRLDVSISIDGDIQDKQIAPLLLLPFVENAFKHGTSNQLEQCWISFNLFVTHGVMHFKLVNSKDNEQILPAFPVGGLGLENVRKRLELLYTEKYTLQAAEDKNVFVVNLQLALDSTIKNNIKSNMVKSFNTAGL